MLRTRLITAAILVACVFYGISFAHNETITLVLFVIFCLLTGVEFVALRWHAIDGYSHTSLPRPPLRKEFWGVGAAYAMVLPLYYYGEVFGQKPRMGSVLIVSWIVLCTVVGSGLIYRREIDIEIAAHKLMNTLAGFLYISIPCLLMFQLSRMSFGPDGIKGLPLYFSLAVVLMGDTGGYFAGRFFGKNLLAPRLSPKKTIEGSIGALLASMLTAIGIVLVFEVPISLTLAASVAAASGVAGQIGDLAESALKRAANCKDSGSLLPGHGGMLDRVDALIFGTPICYVAFMLLG